MQTSADSKLLEMMTGYENAVGGTEVIQLHSLEP
jgi:hypothetical protein